MSDQDILVMENSDSDTSVIDIDEQEFQTDLDPEIINNEIQNDEVEYVQNEIEQQPSKQQYVEQLQIPTINIITQREQKQIDDDKVNLQTKKFSRECDLKTMFKVFEELNHDSKLKITNLLYKGSNVIQSQLIRSLQNLGNSIHYF
ncbi:hypothetical protein pb186bvf_016466 [Paramecium bursaria]